MFNSLPKKLQILSIVHFILSTIGIIVGLLIYSADIAPFLLYGGLIYISGYMISFFMYIFAELCINVAEINRKLSINNENIHKHYQNDKKTEEAYENYIDSINVSTIDI